MQRVGGELDRVATLAARAPPSSSATSSGPISAASSTARPVGQLGDVAAAAARAAAQPSASKLTRSIAPVRERERDPDEVAAGRAAGGAAWPPASGSPRRRASSR